MSELLVRHGVTDLRITQAAFGVEHTGRRTNMPRPLPRQPFRIGFIGTLVKHKGCHVLIEAFKSLPEGMAILKIFGNINEHPQYASELKQSVLDHKSIDFCGVFPNAKIEQIFDEFDVLVVPSLWYENTPLVLYSAQAARCPVVASNLPGIATVIQDKKNGLLFEPGNPRALSNQLLRLIHNPGLILSLSKNAIKPQSTANYVDKLLQIWSSPRSNNN
jgi:glycosyltransferase involved in cell wall biosynthesis